MFGYAVDNVASRLPATRPARPASERDVGACDVEKFLVVPSEGTALFESKATEVAGASRSQPVRDSMATMSRLVFASPASTISGVRRLSGVVGRPRSAQPTPEGSKEERHATTQRGSNRARTLASTSAEWLRRLVKPKAARNAAEARSGSASSFDQRAAYIESLAKLGLSVESACRMEVRGRPAAPSEATSPKTSSSPKQSSSPGLARPAVYTAKVAETARCNGTSLGMSDAAFKHDRRALVYARYVESLALRGLSLESAARIDRAVCRKGAEMLQLPIGKHPKPTASGSRQR